MLILRLMTRLHSAAKKGREEIVELLLDKGAWLDAVDEYNRTPLYYAVFGEHESIVELLLGRVSQQQVIECFDVALNTHQSSLKIVQLLVKNGAPVNSLVSGRCSGKRYPIQLAASYGHEDIFLFLLEEGADINVKGSDGETLLHISAEKGHLPIVEYLVKQGASVNCVTHETYTTYKDRYPSSPSCPSNLKHCGNSVTGFTPLHLAVLSNRYDVAKFLLDNGAIVDEPEKNGKTALHIAVEENYHSIVELLLLYHPDVNNNGNKNVLIDAAILNNDSIIAQRLLEYGFSVDSEYGKNHQLLINAVEKQLVGILQELVRYGIDVNTTVEGVTLLHKAVLRMYKDVCEILLSNKADVNLKDEYNNPPLFYAIHDKEMCELLIRYGADVNIKCGRNTTPIEISIKNEKFDIVMLFLNNGATINEEGIIDLFNTAINQGHIQFIEFILKHYKNFNVNAFDSKGRSPIHCTALISNCRLPCPIETVNYLLYRSSRFGDFDNSDDNRCAIAKLLLSRGADVNLMTKTSGNYNGWTPLFAAARHGFKKLVQVLLQHNADIDSLSFGKFSALQIAITEGNAEIVDVLQKSGADFKLNCSRGLSVLHFACIGGCSETVDMVVGIFSRFHCRNTLVDNPLLDLVNSQDKVGTTPLMVATLKGFERIVETLLCLGANVNVKDNYGKTAIHLASERGYYKLINLLLKFGGDVNSSTDHVHSIHDVLCSGRSLANRILRNHMRKLRAAGLYLSEENYFLAVDEIDNGLDGCYVSLDCCHDELNAMKNYFVDGNISYHDLVTKSINQLSVYARNKAILKLFNSREYEELFPVYSDLIHSRFMMGIRRNNLLEESKRCLYSMNSDFSRLEDYICTEMILTYLSDSELKSVILACTPCNALS